MNLYVPAITREVPRTFSRSGNCIHINAIQVGNNGDATPIMQNYYHETCGWYEQTGSNGTGIAQYVSRMLYVAGYCNCP
jgi:hypothetical protein